MRIWNTHSSEHSMNLVLIGRFKEVRNAEKVEKEIDDLKTQVLKDGSPSFSLDSPEQLRFSEDMLALLRKLNLNTLGPADLNQLISDYCLMREGDRITVTTDEAEVSAFVKLFIEAGAKVEVFSAHDYPSNSDDAI